MAKHTKAKNKLPKRVAGVKLPKQVRRAGGAVIAWAMSPAGRQALAPVLAGAAAAIAGTKQGRKLAADAGSSVAEGAVTAGGLVGPLTTVAGEVLKQAVSGDKLAPTPGPSRPRPRPPVSH